VTQHYVLQLDVPVNYFVTVHVVHTLGHLAHHNRCRFLGKRTSVLKKVEQWTVTGELQQQIDVYLVAEEIVELDEVRMVERTLDFDLPGQLLDCLFVFLSRSTEKITFVDDLQRPDEACFPMPI
jgi:hypothetical protein